MKNRIWKLALLSTPALSLIMSGCGDKSEADAVEQAGEAVRETGQMVAEKSKEAWNDLRDATYDERREVQAFLTDSANTVKSEVSSLMTKVDAKSSAAWDSAKSNYLAAQAEFDAQLSELGQSTEENWDQAKDSAEKAWEKLKDALAELKKTMSEPG